MKRTASRNGSGSGKSRAGTTKKSAVKTKKLDQSQLRALIKTEAKELNLTYKEVVIRARAGDLPQNALGSELRMLVAMLPKRD